MVKNAPKLEGFTFNEKLGLYVADRGLLGKGLSIKVYSDKSKGLVQRAYERCWDSGYNEVAYLAAERLGLLGHGGENIEFTYPQTLELAKLMGLHVGTNKEFMLNDGHIENLFGGSDVAVFFNDVYDFTQDNKEIDVYRGIVTVLKQGKKYTFLDENNEPIKRVRVKSAQAKALREAGEGDVIRAEYDYVAYRDEASFLQSGKRVIEFDEQGIPCKLDNGEYGCIPQKGRYPHGHDHPSQFIGHRWIVDPTKGLVVMHKVVIKYLKPVGRGMYNGVGACSFFAPTTYLTCGIDEVFCRANIFAVTNLENRVEESLRALLLEDSNAKDR